MKLHRFVRWWLLAAFVLLCGRAAVAHEMSMAELELRELAPGEFFWQWTSSGNNEAGEGLSPVTFRGGSLESSNDRTGWLPRFGERQRQKPAGSTSARRGTGFGLKTPNPLQHQPFQNWE